MEGKQNGSGRFFRVSVFAGAFFYLIFSATPQVQATMYSPNSEWFSTANALSMGNTGIASARDPATAMFYNPAALASNRGFDFEFFSPQFEFSTGNFVVAPKITDQSKLASLPKTKELVARHHNVGTHLGAYIYPNFSVRNFAFGILYGGEGAAHMDDSGILYYRSRYLFIPTLGLSAGIWSGLLKIGVAVRAVQIAYNYRQTAIFDDIGYTNSPAEGYGLGVDGGAMLTIPIATLPTFGFVARNIGDTNLTKKAFFRAGQGSVEDAGAAKMAYDGGFSFAPKIGRTSLFTFAADYRDINNRYGFDTYRRINVGIELDLNKMFFLRGGASQGYWTFGFGIAGKSASLDIGTYGEELHPTKYLQQEDRRVVIRYGGRF